MKSLLILLTLLYVTASCNLSSNEARPPKPAHDPFADEKKNFNQQENKWLKKLTEWDVIRYNDSAKWRVYCYYGDDTCKLGSENKPLPPMPLAFLELKLGFAQLNNNKLALLYSFLYNDSTIVRYSGNRSKDKSNYFARSFGVEFDIQADTVIGYLLQHGTLREEGPFRRYENFTHPDLVQFARRNANNLHPWFREEAIRRGLFIQ